MNMDAIIEIYFFQFQINKFIQMLLRDIMTFHYSIIGDLLY